jgi:hypothetical protein
MGIYGDKDLDKGLEFVTLSSGRWSLIFQNMMLLASG